VRFCGYLDEEALAGLLAESTVGVVPMTDDSFVGIPYKFCDYARAGLAVLSSLGGESAALLARYGAGATYAPGDAVSFVRALSALPADDGRRARRMAEETFDAVRLYDGYVAAVLTDSAVLEGGEG
jgi:glycosyltransferase involved in cell wall biosynthesis